MSRGDLTQGRLLPLMLRFSVPYLIARFLQTFYGLADLLIVGQFTGADTIAAVSIGSQVMHMVTVVAAGLATGTMITLSHSVGAGSRDEIPRCIGSSVVFFAAVTAAATALLILGTNGILAALQAPPEAFAQTRQYLLICFAGLPFIIAYNVISSIFRGMGGTRRPMYFVAAAGVVNIALDYFLIGPLGMGAAGAAIATVTAQAISVLLAVISMRSARFGIRVKREDIRPDREVIRRIASIGMPIAVQEGLIQLSFLAITVIANRRGVEISAAVGIVEKVISFLFLVPSAMLSTVSVAAAQNAGAGKNERSKQALRIGVSICVLFGIAVFVICQFTSEQIVSAFARNQENVIRLGGQYLRAYALDCVFAGVHFCFSGFFTAFGKSMYSFIHNIISVVTVRVPGAYLASVLFPATLYPMGLAAPMGSLLSVIICVIMMHVGQKYWES